MMRDIRNRKLAAVAAAVFAATMLAACGGGDADDLVSQGGAGGAVVGKSCTPPPAGAKWPRALPEEVGLSPDGVAALLQEAQLRQSGTFQLFRHGCLVADSVFDPLFGGFKRNMFSHTKTVVSLITGRAVTLGLLSVDDTVGDWFPEADEVHASITVRHLLTQSSGLNMNWPTELNLGTADRVRLALALPVDHEPGTWFEYAQTPPTLLTALVERAVGQDFQAFAQAELFDRIGITRDQWFWLRDRVGHTEGWAWFYAEPNNTLARLGFLMLQQGLWNGERVIAADYMQALRSPSRTNPGYGYLTWLNQGETYINTGFNARIERPRRIVPSAPADLYTSAGFHGQISTVIPSLAIVLTRTQNLADIGGPAMTPDAYAFGADFGEGFYEIMRSLMLAVTDIAYEDPGPWSQPADYAFDIGQYVNNAGVPLASMGLGPLAPGGCNLLGCDGTIAYEGTLRSVEDILYGAVPLR